MMESPATKTRLIEVTDLGVTFKTDLGEVRAVDNISFSVDRGEILGLVGESGSGKSVSTKALIRLLPKSASLDPGTKIVLHRDQKWLDVAALSPRSREFERIRGDDIAMIFQEPMASFSPTHTVGHPIMESAMIHRKVDKDEARRIAIDLLDRVGISDPAERVDQYPWEISGGMRQRAMIAVALASQPALLIADEPTTALDVTIQAQILRLLRELRDDLGMAIIFISHDLGVIADIADRVAVMYLGQIMEMGSAKEVILDPQHPYTRRLLEAIPKIDHLGGRLAAIPGDVPGAYQRPPGCPFQTRCDQRIDGVCDAARPQMTELAGGRMVQCVLHEAEAKL
jgi:peptide/nickel transport system ATP-binding protein